ncbi:hypothetical protein SAMN05519103_06279 [Rhizobiales bacterium GAS113]|nr:hypothetical protein SAMN05519103_06279 [Rhizobiales bacterium GAS113]
MIEMWRVQLSFGDGLIAEEVSDLREDGMQHADRVLANEQIVAGVYDAQSKRHPNSRSRGRLGTPAEVMRLLVLKHVRNWSFGVLEREVRANLVCRDFTRVGGAKTPDAKTMGRWGVALGPGVIKRIHDRIVEIARDEGVAAGRRMRVDTTVVETNIHHPSDSTLLGDGVRVLPSSRLLRPALTVVPASLRRKVSITVLRRAGLSALSVIEEHPFRRVQENAGEGRETAARRARDPCPSVPPCRASGRDERARRATRRRASRRR